MTRRNALLCALSLGAVVSLPAFGSLTDAQKCEATYLKATGKRLQCIFKAREKGVKTGLPPNFVACETKFNATVDKIEFKLGAACPPRPWMGATTRFVDNGDGTLTDNATTLMWELKLGDGSVRDVDNVYPWSGLCSGGAERCQPTADSAALCPTDDMGVPILGCAICPGGQTCNVTDGQATANTIFSYVDGLNDSTFAGHSDWRVPTEDEVLTILAEPATCTVGPPCIDDAFHQGPTSFTASANHWSKSAIKNVPVVAGIVNFANGMKGSAIKSALMRIRAVRNSQ
jgi:hypothetical protein